MSDTLLHYYDLFHDIYSDAYHDGDFDYLSKMDDAWEDAQSIADAVCNDYMKNINPLEYDEERARVALSIAGISWS